MTVARVRFLRGIGQQEPRRALPDKCGHRHNVIALTQPILDHRHMGRRGFNRRALGQFVVHVKQRRVGVREELLFQHAKAHETDHRDGRQPDHHQPAQFERGPQNGRIAAKQETIIALVNLARAALEEVMRQKRCGGQRQQPAQQQRDGNHGKQ